MVPATSKKNYLDSVQNSASTHLFKSNFYKTITAISSLAVAAILGGMLAVLIGALTTVPWVLGGALIAGAGLLYVVKIYGRKANEEAFLSDLNAKVVRHLKKFNFDAEQKYIAEHSKYLTNILDNPRCNTIIQHWRHDQIVDLNPNSSDIDLDSLTKPYADQMQKVLEREEKLVTGTMLQISQMNPSE